MRWNRYQRPFVIVMLQENDFLSNDIKKQNIKPIINITYMFPSTSVARDGLLYKLEQKLNNPSYF
jgi:hypothetical protein